MFSISKKTFCSFIGDQHVEPEHGMSCRRSLSLYERSSVLSFLWDPVWRFPSEQITWSVELISSLSVQENTTLAVPVFAC